MKILIFLLFSINSIWSQDFNSHLWKERIIVVKGAENDEDQINKQFSQFKKQRDKLMDRKLVVYKCIGSNCYYYNWKSEPKSKILENPSDKFQILLFGLDGGLKFKSDSLINPQIVFDVIDSMPMRKAELKRNSN